ncbi:MAG: hypothetical protein Q7T70_10660, partial [Polaromonas sp.]|nr:hypothetical protein [Polaromonas sp.]
KNEFQRPLAIDSTEAKDAVSGSAYAVINYPFTAVDSAFREPASWCEVLMLHLNTKSCRASGTASGPTLEMHVGKKTPQQLKDASALVFDFQSSASSAGYLAVRLNAEKGPLGTHSYRINLQAIPLPGGKTFMHLQYSYGYGMAGRLAMQGYLSTVGSSKVGFTALDNGELVGGVRGAVERNTMRYYLAIDAYMASLAKPPAEQLENRLHQWFDATERYPKQLHEVDKSAYLSMKRSEYKRLQTAS